jgi:hypothetical protein
MVQGQPKQKVRKTAPSAQQQKMLGMVGCTYYSSYVGGGSYVGGLRSRSVLVQKCEIRPEK